MSSPHDARLRIAALQPSISIILDRLGALDMLVACTRYCVEAVPAMAQRSVTIVKDSWSCTTEEILAARPSLVLASVPYRMESLAALLKSGCPVVTLAPHTLADIYADIRLIGSIVHRVEAAESLVAEMAAGDRSHTRARCRRPPAPHRLLRRVGQAAHPLAALGRGADRGRRRTIPWRRREADHRGSRRRCRSRCHDLLPGAARATACRSTASSRGADGRPSAPSAKAASSASPTSGSTPPHPLFCSACARSLPRSILPSLR